MTQQFFSTNKLIRFKNSIQNFIDLFDKINTFNFVFLIYFAFNVIIIGTKFFLIEQGDHSTLSDTKLFPISVLIIVLDCFYYSFICDVLTFTSKLLKIPSCLFLSFVLAILIVNSIFNILDILNSTSNFQMPSFGYFRTYSFPTFVYKDNTIINLPQKSEFNTQIINRKFDAMTVVTEVFKTNNKSMIIIGLAITLSVISILFVTMIGYKKLIKSLQVQPRETIAEINYIFIGQTIFTILDIWLFILFLLNQGQESKLVESAPGNWGIWKSLTMYNAKESTIQELINWERTINKIDNDLFYLDNRETIQFPYLVGDKQAYCKFNNCNETPVKTTEKAKPNIVLVLVESFSSNPLLLKDQEFPEHYKGSPFNATILPNLSNISELGSTNIGVNSLGFPTILGWFGIQTGNLPLRYGIGINQQRRQSHLTLGKYFKNLGYTTAYTSPAPPEFDGKQNVLYNGDWENVQYYKPKEELGFVNLTDSDWIADRFTQEMFQRQIQNLTGPFYANWFTIDTHQYWTGYDQKQYYDNSINQSYVRVANYFDQQFGKLIDFLKKDYNNTIVIVMGDHGPRWAITPHLYSGWDFKCASNAFNDDYFGTSGTVAYLGEDQELINIFNTNSSSNQFTDVNSFLLGFQKKLTKYLGKPLVTNRVPTPVSMTHKVIESRINSITRSYFYDYSRRQEFNKSITCRIYNDSMKFYNKPVSQISKQNLILAKQLVKIRNIISAQNRMWHDDFNCQEDQCQLPDFVKIFDNDFDYFIYTFVCLPLMPTIIFFIVCITVKRIQKKKNNMKILDKEDQALLHN